MSAHGYPDIISVLINFNPAKKPFGLTVIEITTEMRARGELGDRDVQADRDWVANALAEIQSRGLQAGFSIGVVPSSPERFLIEGARRSVHLLREASKYTGPIMGIDEVASALGVARDENPETFMITLMGAGYMMISNPDIVSVGDEEKVQLLYSFMQIQEKYAQILKDMVKNT